MSNDPTQCAHTPQPPYYAVIFTSILRDDTGYQAVAEQMLALARQQPGFLGEESARTQLGITVSYWRDPHSIRQWKAVHEHQQAQHRGQRDWYANYHIRIAKVERDYAWCYAVEGIGGD